MKILVAEDDLTSRIMLKRLLLKWGYQVVAAADGKEAWSEYQWEPPDIVILDWMMPEMDGLEVCRRIRESENAEYVYVILLTSRDQKEDVVRGLEAGANDYITKPFDHAELRSRIRVGQLVVKLQRDLAAKVSSLEEALAQVRQLSGLLPICMHCKKIRDSKDYWHEVEVYIAQHSDTQFSHGLCPECLEKYYPEVKGRPKCDK